MAKYVRCGKLFTGLSDEAVTNGTLIVADDQRIQWAGAADGAPKPGPRDEILDYGALFVMPGLIDVHVHLAYGNAKSEEDIDLYQPMEFRALRALYFAQQVLAAGYTSICAPGDAGRISLSVRNAIKAGLFDGPRVTAAGRYVTSRQGLTDWYPTWIGAPETSIGKLVASRDEAIEEIRCQVKDGVDLIKITMDGVQRRGNGELVASFTQAEIGAMVEEAHRLGKKVCVHAAGREATLYSARAGVDLIFHGFGLDAECIDAILKSGSTLGPTLTLHRNLVDFTQPFEPAAQKGRLEQVQRQYEISCTNLRKALAAGVPFVPGTDSGFAITPYGEWHAKELEIFVRDLGMTAAQALRSATAVAQRFTTEEGRTGTLAQGNHADFVAVEGSPLENISILLDKRRIKHVHVGGRELRIAPRQYDSFEVTDLSWTNWNEVYTQEYVATLRRQTPIAAQ